FFCWTGAGPQTTMPVLQESPANRRARSILRMQCPHCQHNNSATAKFCEECGQRLPLLCPTCGFEAAPSAKFCPECGQRLGSQAPAAERQDTVVFPRVYTPRHLAEKILQAQAALEGERSQVRMPFAGR